MSWRYGGKVSMGPTSAPKAMDMIEVTQADLDADAAKEGSKKVQQKAKRKGRLSEAYGVWANLRNKTKAKLGMDLPGLVPCDAELLQDVIDTDGYGVAVVMQMVDTVVDYWPSVKEQLKWRIAQPTVNLFYYKAPQLRDPKNFIGKGTHWASPDVGDAARKAAEEFKAQMRAKNGKAV